MKAIAIFYSLLVSASVSYGQKFSSTVDFSKSPDFIIKSSDASDFEMLWAAQKTSTGSDCMAKKGQEMKANNQGGKPKKQKMMTFMELAKKCACSSSAKAAHEKIDQILQRHSDWDGKTIMHQASGNERILDMRNHAAMKSNFKQMCGL